MISATLLQSRLADLFLLCCGQQPATSMSEISSKEVQATHLFQRGNTQKSESEYGIALEDMTWVISGCC